MALKTLPNDIDGESFKTDYGKKFKVLKGDYFPKNSIGIQHNKYLNSLRQGLLVSVSFHGQPVPVVTVDKGVVRLVEVEAGGEVVKGSSVISKLLGLTETRQPMGLYSA